MIPAELLSQITVIKIETHHSPIVCSFDALILCAVYAFTLSHLDSLFHFTLFFFVVLFFFTVQFGLFSWCGVVLHVDGVISFELSHFAIHETKTRKRQTIKKKRRQQQQHTHTDSKRAETKVQKTCRAICVCILISVRSLIPFIQLNFVRSTAAAAVVHIFILAE